MIYNLFAIFMSLDGDHGAVGDVLRGKPVFHEREVLVDTSCVVTCGLLQQVT